MAAAVACNDVQPTDPNGPLIPTDASDRAAQVSLSARLYSDTLTPGAARWRIDAAMHPGLDEGIVREANDTLWLDGEPFVPVLKDRGYRRYAAEIETTLDRIHERLVTVLTPAVEGVAPAPTIEFAGIGRPGGDTIPWTPGSDLVFRLTVPTGAATPAPERSDWLLYVIQDSTRLTLQSSGLPPDSITVEGRYFSAGGSQIVASFAYRFSRYDTSDDPKAYLLRYSAAGNFSWVVEVVEPGT